MFARKQLLAVHYVSPPVPNLNEYEVSTPLPPMNQQLCIHVLSKPC